MMLGLRARMAITAMAASATALVAVLVLVGPGLRRSALDHTRDGLLAEARLMAHVVEQPLEHGMPDDDLDRLVDEAGKEVRARVTIVAPDGRVLADTALSGPELHALENHRDRPEVREAFANGTGSSVRHSATVKEDLLYAAVAIHDRAGRVIGISRVALSLAGVEAQVQDFQWAVAAALGLAFLITAVLSASFAGSLAGPLRQIMTAAREFGRGNLAARIRVRRHDEMGELAHILNQTANQLQERLAENAQERARTDAILSAMEDGVLAVDHRGVVLLANETLRRSLELADPVGRHYLEAIRQREVGAVLGEVLATGERRTAEVELRPLRRVFSLAAVRFPGDEGMPEGAVVTFHDVTERRHLERVRRDFVANASHELRTPLTSIRGFVEALQDGADAEAATSKRFLEKIRTHADRMAALVEDLLELSRLESGERPPRWEEVVPSDLAEEVVVSFADLAERKPIELTRTDHDTPLVVTDGDRVRRIVDNLVENAIKYTPAGGHVQLATRGDGHGGAVIEVNDDGPGIGPEHLPRIFERFYRVDKARSRDLGGTGLGLSIVKHLAESIGATIAVSSEVGKGTRFAVTIPVRAQTS